MHEQDCLISLQNIEGRPYYKSVLYGPVCAEIDCICEQVLPEYERGEWLYFENAGAYSPNFHCAFNGFVKPPRLYIVEAKDRYACGNFFSKKITCLETSGQTHMHVS